MKKEFLIERNGRQFALYAGLLDEAHERGLKGIRTTLIQIPSDLNAYTAICHAEVETAAGTFSGLGDASPENVSRMMAPHLIRMAETRAKARALRDAVNVGVTALEEMGELDEPAKAAVERGFPPNPPDDEEPHYREVPDRRYEEPVGARPGAAPATPKQYQTIQRMSRAAGKQYPTEGLTRAQASEIISTLIGEMDQRSAQ